MRNAICDTCSSLRYNLSNVTMKIDGTYIEAHVEPDGGFCIFHDCAPPQAYYRSEESPLELPTLIFSLVYIINCFFLSNAIKTYLYQKVDFV